MRLCCMNFIGVNWIIASQVTDEQFNRFSSVHKLNKYLLELFFLSYLKNTILTMRFRACIRLCRDQPVTSILVETLQKMASGGLHHPIHRSQDIQIHRFYGLILRVDMALFSARQVRISLSRLGAARFTFGLFFAHPVEERSELKLLTEREQIHPPIMWFTQGITSPGR